ncbi:MAG: nicotinate phosphoribosyltransferase, partial [Leifsonia sp.]
ITVTNDLDEHAIAALRSAPVNSYGVGTALVTGSGSPAAGMIYKLVAHLDGSDPATAAWLPVGKKSDGKATVAGRKQPVRALLAGTAVAEDIYVEDPPVDAAAGRPLLVDLVRDGAPVDAHLGAAGVIAARAHHAAAIAELQVQALSLSRGEPAIPTRYL